MRLGEGKVETHQHGRLCNEKVTVAKRITVYLCTTFITIGIGAYIL